MEDDKFDFSLWKFIIKSIKPLTCNKAPFSFSNQQAVCNSTIGNSDKVKAESNYIKEDLKSYNLKSYSIDYNTKLKVNKGRYSLDDQLDLHGYSVDHAYLTLTNFITKHYYTGSRCLLIITGCGKKLNTGLIKSNFANWLDSNKIQHMILYYTQATKMHGGKGAFYVLLKRIRKKT